ncbi:hypothetical protein [Mesorhizobium sp. M0520]|uniref:hypothetical protein n=1 Tax=unclassified Mesorhizobium TaxID=325217 RepID=UPI0033370E1A
MLDGAAGRSDPPPSANQAGVAEQGFLDRQRVEAGHVPAHVTAFDIEAILLRDHGKQNRAAGIRRPMIGLNHRTRIDSFL